MIAVTGALGFIGSHLVHEIKESPILAVDHKSTFDRPYLGSLKFEKAEAEDFIKNLKTYPLEMILHMGAISSTSETDWEKLLKWNVNYTQKLWEHCRDQEIPFIYASSGATYGDGTLGFSDSDDLTFKLKPLNLYGKSKHQFDLYALNETKKPKQWYGLKFFNVYGPHEDHKGRQGSSIFNGYKEIKNSGAMTLFRSHNPDYKDGEQARDFIYIKDVVSALKYLLNSKATSGIYNLGTGVAQNYNQLSDSIFKSLKIKKTINWVDTPPEFRGAYQYKTQAEVKKLRDTGFKRPFTSLEQGVDEYIKALTHS